MSNICVTFCTRMTPECSNSACTRDSSTGAAARLRRRLVPPAALHGHDRLRPAEPAGQPRELARVAERLEVEQNDVRGGVGLPVLQHVVARQVGTVAGRYERRQAQPPLRRRRRAGRCPSAPDWLKKPTRPAAGIVGASVAFSRTCGSVFATPSAFGPTTRIPCARASSTSRRWAVTPSGPASANPALSTTSAFTPLARQESMTSLIPAAGTATTARSTSSGMSVTAG